MKRYACIYFPYLLTDWWTRRQPALANIPFVLAAPDHGRLVVTDINYAAHNKGIYAGMVVADARAIFPNVEVINLKPALREQLLNRMAQWCIRFTPVASVDLPDGITLDITGCAHLWGGEMKYIEDISNRFSSLGFNVKIAIADTIGAAWAVAHFTNKKIVSIDNQRETIQSLSPAALRIPLETVDKLSKIGLNKIEYLLDIPRAALARRFGESLIIRLMQALGETEEIIQPVILPAQYEERLPCIEPISTATGISIALEKLMDKLCARLQKEEKGLRVCIFKGWRIDGKIEQAEIGTNRATNNIQHLLKLFEEKIQLIEPDLGIELFTLEAKAVEKLNIIQEKLWENAGGLHQHKVVQLLDRIAGKFGAHTIYRYLPDEHYWPERSVKRVNDLAEQLTTTWNASLARPILLLPVPEVVHVMAPVPDYPPKLFRYKGKVHQIQKAEGPERIEQEWWLQNGQHRDYYAVEDDEGKRYWLFRSGHYGEQENTQWFLHGYFA